jgi:fructokinase
MAKLNMHLEDITLSPTLKSTCIGAGLVALDVILNGSPSTPAKLCAGGTCGNVLSILSFLNWDSKPIARLKNNIAATELVKDLSKFNVSTSLISTLDDGSTPVIIHRILNDKFGKPRHKFEFKVPNTSHWLPQYKSVLKLSVNKITENQPTTDVFFFDRATPSTLDLAKYYKDKGALIVFEPSSLKLDKCFVELLKISNIIKFSNDRIGNYSEVFPTPNSDLEIMTMGDKGLKYRLKSDKKSSWKIIAPFEITNELIDSAGAGDWCTAGIINQLGYNGMKSFVESSEDDIQLALKLGQALGALNCSFNGARGMMYSLKNEGIEVLVNKLFKEDAFVISEHKDNNVNMNIVENFSFDMIL